MHDAMPAGIWPHNPLLPRQGNGHTRHTLSIQSPARPQPSIGYCYPPCLHNTNPQGSFPASLHQWPRNVGSHWPHHHWLAQGHQGSPSSPLSKLATQRFPHHWGWSSPVRWSTHHSSCQKGESPASAASIPSRNNKVKVACVWKFLLAQHQQGHWRGSPPVWNLHMVPESECYSIPHTYTPHHLTHGRCVPQTSSCLKELTTW